MRLTMQVFFAPQLIEFGMYPQIMSHFHQAEWSLPVGFLFPIFDLKEEIVLSQQARDKLPDPGDSREKKKDEDTYLVFRIHFSLEPDDIKSTPAPLDKLFRIELGRWLTYPTGPAPLDKIILHGTHPVG